MIEDLVTLRSFADRFEAEFAQEFLAAHGIPSMLLADDCGGMRPYLMLGAGGPRLRVLRQHVADARELLETRLPIPAAPPAPVLAPLPLPADPEAGRSLPETLPAPAQAPPLRVVPRGRRARASDG